MNDDCSSVYAVSVLSALAARHRGMRCLKTLVPVSLFPSLRLREPNPTVVALLGSQQGSDGTMLDSAGTMISLYSTSNSLAQLR
jgi:hypothetical protein